MSAPKNIIELRTSLLENFEQLKKDPRRLAQVAEMTNVAGKVLDTVKIRMTQHAMAGEVLEDDFLGPTSGKSLIKGKLLNP